jgi:hypothetical protein
VTLLGNAILDEHRRLTHPPLPRDVARQTGEQIDSLLDDPGIQPDEIREALARLRTKPKLGPGILPNLVHEVRQEQAHPGLAVRGSPAGRRQQETDAMFERAMQRADMRERQQ